MEKLPLKKAWIRYITELGHLKKVSNSYEWYRDRAKKIGIIVFTDVSKKGGDINLKVFKIGNKWFVEKLKFEIWLGNIKENLKDYNPGVRKWWKS